MALTFLKQLKVVIASPNDVSEERETLNILIQDVNNFPAEDLGLILKVVRWDTDAYAGFHAGGPQGLVDEILKIEDCDILIGIFWKRFGTPTWDGRTRTEHEIKKAIEAWEKTKKRPQIMIYFNEKEYFPKTPEESKQQTAVLESKRDFPKERLYWEYNGLTQFQKLVTMHLRNYLRQSFSFRTEVQKKPQESIKRDVDKLSERIMLMASGKHCFVIMPYSTTGDKHTTKYWDRFFSNFIKPAVENLGYTCKRSSADPGNIMKAIVSELVNSDLVLAVLTDYNPNVLYELGTRHSLKHGTIMMLETGQHIPFDISSTFLVQKNY